MAEGEPFGQRPPPLSTIIRQILGRYPDGQIFKEMIQNADDAGASIVQFYVDSRQHGSKGLVKPELAAYQGPALISANDAIFTKEDWQGLQNLQRSVKADDPFKVGRFGIGFNSVYHLTDFPSIISGDKIVFLEPQEQVWTRQSGRSFSLAHLSGTDHLAPFNGIANFSSSNMPSYSKTLFRLPLRQKASDISKNTYDVQDVYKLIEGLRSEAKLVLLFLQSVRTIEVHTIDDLGVFAPLLRVTVASNSLSELDKKKSFCSLLKSYCGSQQSHVSSVTLKLDVCVNDFTSEKNTTSHWFITNRVDSTNEKVRSIANELKLLPWVGTAVELDSPGNGRIFCLLPVPAIDNAFDFPVHVNGMFGLTDDRRSLKWPTLERRNDPMADWNHMLVKHVVHPCYVDLLLEAKLYFHGSTFYDAWPDYVLFRQWEPIINPLFSALLSHNVILAESGEWVSPNTPIYLPKTDNDESISTVVKFALSNCHVKLAEVPKKVWRAFKRAEKLVTEVSPSFVLEMLRNVQESYVNLSPPEKMELLEYCLSGKNYLTLTQELIGIQLLPLADGSFISFQHNSNPVYVCTGKCPMTLLPNLGHRLVNLSNQNLRDKFLQIARKKLTQLRELDASAVSELLDESMPSSWRDHTSVTLPHGHFNSEWLETFWKWLQNQQLALFQDRLIFPVRHGTKPAPEQFSVIRLSNSEPALCIPSDGDDDTLFSILNKFGIRYCTRSSFGYVKHQALASYFKTYPEGLFESIAVTPNYSVELSLDEAKHLRRAALNAKFLDRRALLGLKIYSTCNNTNCRLYSLNNAIVIFEPKSHPFDLSQLPPSIVIISSRDNDQVLLLQKLDYAIQGVDNFIKCIVSHLKSLRSHQYGNGIDQFFIDALNMYRSKSQKIPAEFHDLPFVKVASGTRKRPSELYNPNDTCLTDMLFQEEDSFPSAPYNTSECVRNLKDCGLQSTVAPQKILDIIYLISLPASFSPQPVSEQKMLCARAILNYLASTRFHVAGVSGFFRLNSRISSTPVLFQEALTLLSRQRCWLPVLSKSPSKCLPWKGARYTSHFIALGESVYVYSSDSFLPFLHGPRAYFTHPCAYLSNNFKYKFTVSIVLVLCACIFILCLIFSSWFML